MFSFFDFHSIFLNLCLQIRSLFSVNNCGFYSFVAALHCIKRTLFGFFFSSTLSSSFRGPQLFFSNHFKVRKTFFSNLQFYLFWQFNFFISLSELYLNEKINFYLFNVKENELNYFFISLPELTFKKFKEEN